MSTLRDVARRARVPVATAARALGGYGYVSPRTRERVPRAAQAPWWSIAEQGSGRRSSTSSGSDTARSA
jgi:DNA-binding LacI/PurR family transcriptional regulator